MHTLLHIYGPIAIHSYGLMIALALLIFIYLMRRDPRFSALNLEPHFGMLLIIGIAAAIIGGRFLYFYTYPDQFKSIASFFAFYEGGFSILGSIMGVFFTVLPYLWYYQIPIVPLFDLAAIYTPLLQSISRIGCFLAGCCYGVSTTVPWGIIYTDTGSVAPLYICLHPTQIYSSILLMCIFAFQYFIGRRLFHLPGQLLCSYLLLIGLERFSIDFWRGDRIIGTLDLSVNQLVALGFIGAALLGLALSRLLHRS